MIWSRRKSISPERRMACCQAKDEHAQSIKYETWYFARSAQVGWFPTYTMTEDYALGLELKKEGYQCRYVRDYLALGENLWIFWRSAKSWPASQLEFKAPWILKLDDSHLAEFMLTCHAVQERHHIRWVDPYNNLAIVCELSLWADCNKYLSKYERYRSLWCLALQIRNAMQQRSRWAKVTSHCYCKYFQSS